MANKNLTAAAQAVTDKFFSAQEDQQGSVNNAAQAAQESRQNVRTGKSSPAQKDAEKAGKTAQERRVTSKGKVGADTKVFSFRSWIDEVDGWRSYAAVKGLKIDELGAAAMNEYIKRHPITDVERTLQEALEAVRRARK